MCQVRLRFSVYNSIVHLRANHGGFFLLPKLSQLRLFRADDTSLALDIFMQSKKKAVANSKATEKFHADNVPKYEGIATLHVMAVYSRDLG